MYKLFKTPGFNRFFSDFVKKILEFKVFLVFFLLHCQISGFFSNLDDMITKLKLFYSNQVNLIKSLLLT